jgi:hypothetical protein
MNVVKLIPAMFPLLLALGSCIAQHHPIPIGTYVTPSGDESVSAFESELHFRVRVDEKHPERLIDRTFSYTVEKDGEIIPHTMTSIEAAFGVGRYDWYWDGETIIRRDWRSGETANFTRKRPTQ